MKPSLRGLNLLQKISMSLMAVLVVITFVGANMHALLWQSSKWLVSTVLPSVVVELTNEERADNTTPPLVRNSTLDRAAEMKAEHMAENQYFSHFSPDGVSPWYWFDEAGYVYAHAGENLAIHFTDSSEVVEAWMKSPTHRRNIVNSLYTEIGVGTAKGRYDGYNTVYVVQLFGTPAISPTVTTAPDEPEATAATSPEVAVEPELAQVTDEENLLVQVESQNVTTQSTLAETNEAAKPEPESEPIDKPVVDEVPVTPSEPESVYTNEASDVVVIESPVIATSSGLAVAETNRVDKPSNGVGIASFATQPNTLLQLAYVTLAIIIVLMLVTSLVLEARKLHFQQVAYSLFLLMAMTGLWYANSFLTTGAVVV